MLPVFNANAVQLRAAQSYFGFAKIVAATGAIGYQVTPNIVGGSVRNGAGSYTLTMNTNADPGVTDDVNAAPVVSLHTAALYGVCFRSGPDTWEVRTYDNLGAATDADFSFHWLQERTD